VVVMIRIPCNRGREASHSAGEETAVGGSSPPRLVSSLGNCLNLSGVEVSVVPSSHHSKRRFLSLRAAAFWQAPWSGSLVLGVFWIPSLLPRAIVVTHLVPCASSFAGMAGIPLLRFYLPWLHGIAPTSLPGCQGSATSVSLAGASWPMKLASEPGPGSTRVVRIIPGFGFPILAPATRLYP